MPQDEKARERRVLRAMRLVAKCVLSFLALMALSVVLLFAFPRKSSPSAFITLGSVLGSGLGLAGYLLRKRLPSAGQFLLAASFGLLTFMAWFLGASAFCPPFLLPLPGRALLALLLAALAFLPDVLAAPGRFSKAVFREAIRSVRSRWRWLLLVGLPLFLVFVGTFHTETWLTGQVSVEPGAKLVDECRKITNDRFVVPVSIRNDGWVQLWFDFSSMRRPPFSTKHDKENGFTVNWEYISPTGPKSPKNRRKWSAEDHECRVQHWDGSTFKFTVKTVDPGPDQTWGTADDSPIRISSASGFTVMTNVMNGFKMTLATMSAY